MKTIYGSRIAELSPLVMGGRMTIPGDMAERYRTTAFHMGWKLRIVERREGLAVIERVAETRWGKIKAIVCNLSIGQRITVPIHKKLSYVSCAQRVRVSLHTVSESNGLATLERAETRSRVPVKSKLVALRVGQSMRVAEYTRALSLCAAAYNYGIRLSRAKISTGEYILTRAA